MIVSNFIKGAFVTGAVVGGAVASTMRPRVARQQVVVVHEPPRGVVLNPHETLVLITCPPECRQGSPIEIDVEGQVFNITVPPGIEADQPFYVRVPISPPPSVAAAAMPQTATMARAQPVQPPLPYVQSVQSATVTATKRDIPTSTCSAANPFDDEIPDDVITNSSSDEMDWVVAPRKAEFDMAFRNAGPSTLGEGSKLCLSPLQVRDALIPMGLAKEELRRVWELSDIDKDGALDTDEFAVALHLVHAALEGNTVPRVLPPNVVPPSKRNPF
mmetsp:Transcript_30155/g.50862  ORF Transcript_30155/g.50862 Transcript_30155/m.50862 type:complete len:273 (+) Transcript_30155:54-872(+)